MDQVLLDNVRDLLGGAIGHAAATPALILADRQSPLARLLADAYRTARPAAAILDVDEAGSAEVLAAIDALPKGSLVVLLESTRFDFGAFRFRIELFKRGLAVVEHPHLARVPDAEIPVYVDALAYDAGWYRGMGRALKARLDRAGQVEVRTPGAVATWRGAFEPVRLNVGDYAGMPNVGGQFPIGEVFTELVDVEGLDGGVTIGAFGASDFSVRFGPPFTLELARGRVVGAPDAPPAFRAILDEVAAAEGDVWVRELGFGLNRAMTETRRLSDVSAYERMCGIHLSLGAKHAVYPKPGFNKRHTRFHVDVFCAAPTVLVDGEQVYAEGAWTVAAAAE